MSMSASLHRPKSAEVQSLVGCENDNLKINGGDCFLNIFVPSHVATATAKAFNRAMQAVTVTGGFDYTTKAGIWHISRIRTGHDIWQFQHNDIDVDSPGYMHGDAKSIIAAMDEIDALVDENHCDECDRMAGLENLIEYGRGTSMRMVCKNCMDDIAERERGLAEMAGDDKAHAWAERNAE